jgi:hypothetical protein
VEFQLDRDGYEESQLIQINVPLTRLSYYHNCRSFERVNGQIEIGGLMYNYVKRRLYNDSAELFCIPNYTMTQLKGANIEIFKTVNDLPHSNPNAKGGMPSKSQRYHASDDFTHGSVLGFDHPSFALKEYGCYLALLIAPSFHPTIEYPPEIC